MPRGTPENWQGFSRAQSGFSSIQQLRGDCLSRLPVAPGITLAPGRFLRNDASQKELYWRINGTYGLQLRTPNQAGDLPLAQMGFEIEGDTVVITHPPQGIKGDIYESLGYTPGENRRRRTFLSMPENRDHFKENLLIALIEVAKALKPLGIIKITAQSVDHMEKFRAKISWVMQAKERARKSADDLYPKFGFQTDANGDFFLTL
jgi:hypothetical protein